MSNTDVKIENEAQAAEKLLAGVIDPDNVVVAALKFIRNLTTDAQLNSFIKSLPIANKTIHSILTLLSLFFYLKIIFIHNFEFILICSIGFLFSFLLRQMLCISLFILMPVTKWTHYLMDKKIRNHIDSLKYIIKNPFKKKTRKIWITDQDVYMENGCIFPLNDILSWNIEELKNAKIALVQLRFPYTSYLSRSVVYFGLAPDFIAEFTELAIIFHLRHMQMDPSVSIAAVSQLFYSFAASSVFAYTLLSLKKSDMIMMRGWGMELFVLLNEKSKLEKILAARQL